MSYLILNSFQRAEIYSLISILLYTNILNAETDLYANIIHKEKNIYILKIFRAFIIYLNSQVYVASATH